VSEETPGDEGVRAAEVIGALCLATDLGMASPERTTEMLEGAGFSGVRTEEVPVRFEAPDVDEYLSFIADTSGPLGLALRGLPETDRAAVRADVLDSLARFAAEGGYELPGVALCAVAK
jgi:hypothetical protein